MVLDSAVAEERPLCGMLPHPSIRLFSTNVFFLKKWLSVIARRNYKLIFISTSQLYQKDGSLFCNEFESFCVENANRLLLVEHNLNNVPHSVAEYDLYRQGKLSVITNFNRDKHLLELNPSYFGSFPEKEEKANKPVFLIVGGFDLSRRNPRLVIDAIRFLLKKGYDQFEVVAVGSGNFGELPQDIQSFIQYVKRFTQPIQQVAQVANMLQSTAAASERVFEFLEEEEEDQTVEHPVSVENLEGNVSFDHVHFGYNADKIIVNDFSAEVKEGQKIAIVGPTGAGKTTMIKLLMRFYDVNSGAIKIDGHDVRDFNRSELREMFGMVLQDTWLFKGSIEDNIRYGRLDATHEEVVEAAKAARAHRFIKTLPGGYQMELNEEASNVSQGQKQLLTIARAMLADPKILILDEATSSVDTRTEIQIQKAMDQLMKGRTSFVIAHRLSTIRDADVILVMKDGDIVEQGNHEELLAQNGFYAELYNSQFERSA